MIHLTSSLLDVIELSDDKFRMEISKQLGNQTGGFNSCSLPISVISVDEATDLKTVLTVLNFIYENYYSFMLDLKLESHLNTILAHVLELYKSTEAPRNISLFTVTASGNQNEGSKIFLQQLKSIK